MVFELSLSLEAVACANGNVCALVFGCDILCKCVVTNSLSLIRGLWRERSGEVGEVGELRRERQSSFLTLRFARHRGGSAQPTPANALHAHTHAHAPTRTHIALAVNARRSSPFSFHTIRLSGGPPPPARPAAGLRSPAQPGTTMAAFHLMVVNCPSQVHETESGQWRACREEMVRTPH